MKMNQIKSFVFGIAFIGAMAIGGTSAFGQEESEPCPDGSDTNQWGGVCCQSSRSCQHPWAGNIAESTWRDCVRTCL